MIYITVGKYGKVTEVGKRKMGVPKDIGKKEILVDLHKCVIKQIIMLALNE